MTPDDQIRLTAWLDAHAPGVGDGSLEARVLSGGASNLVMAIRRGGPEVVLRRPPERPRPDSEKIIGREARVLAALAGTDVPHPRFIAYCDDLSVIGVRFCRSTRWVFSSVRNENPFCFLSAMSSVSTKHSPSNDS